MRNSLSILLLCLCVSVHGQSLFDAGWLNAFGTNNVAIGGGSTQDTNGLVSRWLLTSLAGTNDSFGTNNLSLVTIPGPAIFLNGGLDLTNNNAIGGATNYLYTGNNVPTLNLTGDFSLFAWIWIYSVNPSQGPELISHWGGSSVQQQFLMQVPDNSFHFIGAVFDGGSTYGITANGNPLPTGQWVFVAVIKSGTSITTYTNLVQDQTHSCAATIQSLSTLLAIGTDAAALTTPAIYSIGMKNILIYNVAKTLPQQTNIFNNP